MNTRQRYPTDVTDTEWSDLAPPLPTSKATGRPRLHAVREILTAIFDVLRSGCAWRLLPHALPPQALSIRALAHPADPVDREGARLLLASCKDQRPRLQHIWADSADAGKCTAWVQSTWGWTLEIVQHWWTGSRGVWVAPGQQPPPIPSGLHGLPRRWVAERTFACLTTNRRLRQEYEELPATSEAWIYLAMSKLMVRRLAS